jgi:hypothetical protein
MDNLTLLNIIHINLNVCVLNGYCAKYNQFVIIKIIADIDNDNKELYFATKIYDKNKNISPNFIKVFESGTIYITDTLQYKIMCGTTNMKYNDIFFSDFMNKKCSYLMMENAGNNNAGYFIHPNYNITFSKIISLLFIFLYSVYLLENASINHGDLHFYNIYIAKINKKYEYIEYKVYDELFYITLSELDNYHIKIGDFGESTNISYDNNFEYHETNIYFVHCYFNKLLTHYKKTQEYSKLSENLKNILMNTIDDFKYKKKCDFKYIFESILFDKLKHAPNITSDKNIINDKNYYDFNCIKLSLK